MRKNQQTIKNFLAGRHRKPEKTELKHRRNKSGTSPHETKCTHEPEREIELANILCYLFDDTDFFTHETTQ